MKYARTVVVFLCLFFVTSISYAGVLGRITGWFSWTAVALIITGLLAVGAIGRYTPWLSKLLIVLGALFTDAGLALADGKVSADELKKAKANFIDVKNIFKPQVK